MPAAGTLRARAGGGCKEYECAETEIDRTEVGGVQQGGWIHAPPAVPLPQSPAPVTGVESPAAFSNARTHARTLMMMMMMI